MAEDLTTFRHQVVLVTRDFCPRPGAPDVSASRRFGAKPLNTPRHFGTKTFRHQNISTQGGWMANPRDFYRYINNQKKDNQGIPPLKRRGGPGITASEIEQAEEFNG